jgi:DNA-binding NarL/FixJ family response regulator
MIGSGMIRVLLVDDQQIVRSGLSMILGVLDDIEVVAEAANGREAVDMVRSHRPDVVLMDVRMPVMDGIEATAAITNDPANAATSVVMLTTFDLDEFVDQALRAGAKGFLLKDAAPALIAEAIRAAVRGDTLIDPVVTKRLVATYARKKLRREMQLVNPLTERELDVLNAISRGASNAEIGEELFVSLSTVKTHVASLLNKTGCRDRVQLVIFAYDHGIVDGDEVA